MNLLLVYITLHCIHFVRTDEQVFEVKAEEGSKNSQINETVTQDNHPLRINSPPEAKSENQQVIKETTAENIQSDGTTEQPSVTTTPKDENEDQQIINETFAKYGCQHDFTKLALPGPELLIDNERFEISDQFNGELKNYTLRIRAITEHFSYNARYEDSRLKKITDKYILVIKGQFGEHFERKNGGYYIRTIGYTLDENGFQQCLINLSTARTTTTEFSPIASLLGPSGPKVSISSTVLGTLIGGNTLG